jgi:hypothetical protein
MFEFTVCRSAQPGLFATKTLYPPPRAAKQYDLIEWWLFCPTAVGFEDMADLLRRLMVRPDCMIVRGEPVAAPGPDGWTREQSRRWVSAPITLRPVPRRWVGLDLDDAAVAAPLGDGDSLGEAALDVREYLLPPEFRDVRMIACATSSTGIKGPTVARLRLFALLDGPVEDAVLKRWAKGVRAATDLPLDDAVFQPGQPIYTSRPIFSGRDDPVPEDQRVIVLDGRQDAVTLQADRYAGEVRRIEVRVRSAIGSARGDWRKALDQMIGVDGCFFEPLSRGLGLAARAGADEADVTGHVAALLGERADKGRQRQYDGEWVSRTLKRFRNADARAAAQLAADQHRLFSSDSPIPAPKGVEHMSSSFDVPRPWRPDGLCRPHKATTTKGRGRARLGVSPASTDTDTTTTAFPTSTMSATAEDAPVRAAIPAATLAASPEPPAPDEAISAAAGAAISMSADPADQWPEDTAPGTVADNAAAVVVEAKALGKGVADDARVRQIIEAGITAGADALSEDTIVHALAEASGRGVRTIQRLWREVDAALARAIASAAASLPIEARPFFTLTDDEKAAEAARLRPLCAHLLQEPDLLAVAAKSAAQFGLTGEHRVLNAVLLAGVGRLFAKPVHVSVKGLSASGKSYSVGAGLWFLPPAAYHKLTGASSKSLVHMPPGTLKHRLLVMAEATVLVRDDEHNEFAGLLRCLQSENEIRYATVIKNGDKWEQVSIVQEGPTGLVVTTTATSIHAENETRQLSVQTDETPAQTRRVLVSLAGQGDPAPPPLEAFADWHALYRWIEVHPLGVSVPFANWLANRLPVQDVRVRRDFSQLLSLIRAHALLHQPHRQQDAEGCVVAEPQDYGAVAPLVATTLAAAGGAILTPGEILVWNEVRRRVQAHVEADAEWPILSREKQDEAVLGARIEASVRNLAEAVGRSFNVVAAHLRGCTDKGWIVRDVYSRGQAGQLGIGAVALPNTHDDTAPVGFPTQSEVEAARSEWDADTVIACLP